ncbi:hypothetical protein [Streptomyces sp. NPDC047525]|uniref:hypothetical protein n=1 Tax=Streptomyces sp. NPDC047525 TaxID=3155264 RepID=UPI0033E522C7
MTDYAQKYAAALDKHVLNYFPDKSFTENAEAALAGWVSTEGLPEHHMWLAAVMFRCYDGVNPLMAALALADDAGHLTWNPDHMSDRSERGTALMDYWLLDKYTESSLEERERLIRKALPLYGVDADATDIELARTLFDATLLDDAFRCSLGIQSLLQRCR